MISARAFPALPISADLRAYPPAAHLSTWSFFGVVELGISSWGQSFDEGVVEAQPGFEAERWADLFRRHPWARAVYRAEDWQEASAQPARS